MIRNRLVNAGWNPQRAERIHKAAEGLSPRQQNAVVNKALAPRSIKYTSKALLTPDEKIIAHIEKRKNSNTTYLISKSLPYREREWDEEKHKRDENGRFSSVDRASQLDTQVWNSPMIQVWDNPMNNITTGVASNDISMTQPEMKDIQMSDIKFTAATFVEAVMTMPEFKEISMSMSSGEVLNKKKDRDKLEALFESKSEMYEAVAEIRQEETKQASDDHNAEIDRSNSEVNEANTYEVSEDEEETENSLENTEFAYKTTLGGEKYNVGIDCYNLVEDRGEEIFFDYEDDEPPKGILTENGKYYLDSGQLEDLVGALATAYSDNPEAGRTTEISTYRADGDSAIEETMAAEEVLEMLDETTQIRLVQMAVRTVPITVLTDEAHPTVMNLGNNRNKVIQQVLDEMDDNTEVSLWERFKSKSSDKAHGLEVYFDNDEDGLPMIPNISYVKKGHYNPTPDSSFVKGTYYSKRKRRLTVKLDSGRDYDFEGVNRRRAREFKNTPSQGQAFNALRRENAARSK